ncbi:MAG: hypothetical protein Q8S41_00515, partial [Lutibacter sp.]|nr:hypothetical protein [Lutibacter sp.]
MKKITLINLATFLVLLFSTVVGYSQLAPVTVPTGGFHIDGDLQSNTPTNGVGDWIAGTSGSGGGYVFDNAGNPINISRTLRVIDRYDSTLDNIFTGGGKFNQNPSTAWSWTSGKSGGKGDINNVFLHLGEEVISSTQSNQWLIIASDRFVTTGTSYIDFEFLQGTLTANVGGSFTAGGPNNGRTIGDLLIAVEYSNGGSTATVKFYKWEAVGSGFDYVLETPPPGAFGKTNLVPAITFNLGAFGNNSYAPYQFVEAAINITAFFSINDPCGGATFGNILVKTKSSNASTAALDDFVNPIPVQLNLGTASISYNTSDFCGATAAVTINGVGGGTFSSSSPTNLIINSTNGDIDVAASAPGTYTVTYSYTTAGCPKTADVQVIIPSASPPPTTSPIAYCVGDTASALTATGTNLLWYTAAIGGTGSPTAPTPSTVSAGTTTYYVSQTITNSCESSRASLVVTIDAQPVVSNQPNQTLCNTSTFTMTQSAPSVGSGLWTLVNGTATITSPSSPTTTITGVAAGT